MRGSYDYRLVALSVVFALLAAYAALDLAGRVTATRRWWKALRRGGGEIGAAFLDRVLTKQRSIAEASRKDELYFRTLAEALPEMIWTANPDGFDDFFSRKWYEYTGLTFEQSLGAGWTVAIHPDDLEPCLEKWKAALRTGEPYEVEYRFRRGSDGLYRWFLGRANPIRDATGEIVKWFGTATDIEDQKHNQQILEDQIKARTAELAEANTRLQEEMWESCLLYTSPSPRDA